MIGRLKQTLPVVRAGCTRSESIGARRCFRILPAWLGAWLVAGAAGIAQPAPEHGDLRDLDLGDGNTLQLVYLEGGIYQRGSSREEQDWAVRRGCLRRDVAAEGPVHDVELDGFWMATRLVTEEQYQAVVGAGPYRVRNPSHPVARISWVQAEAFCRLLAERTGEPVRLPTEAEWEYACRAGSRTRFPFGDSAARLGDYAWYEGNSGGRPHPVGLKQPNAWGLHDMLGNVWEWCSDWFDPQFYSRSPRRNPAGPASGGAGGVGRVRSLRGGSFGNHAGFLRPAFRGWYFPTNTDVYGGIRIVIAPAP